MQNLKNNFILLILMQILFACQSTKNFEIKSYEKEELHVIKVASNRIIHECYFLNAEKENNWRHQYSLFILNDKNEVIRAMYPTNQDDDQCNTHLKKVEKILKKNSRVTLCVRDKLKRASGKDEYTDQHDFSLLGKYKQTYNPLTFDAICNSKECHSISETWTTTCPGFKKLME